LWEPLQLRISVYLSPAVLLAQALTLVCCKSLAVNFSRFNQTFSRKMTNIQKQIPALTESEFGALFFLFDEGARVNPHLQNHPAVRSALFALLNAENITLPGES